MPVSSLDQARASIEAVTHSGDLLLSLGTTFYTVPLLAGVFTCGAVFLLVTYLDEAGRRALSKKEKAGLAVGGVGLAIASLSFWVSLFQPLTGPAEEPARVALELDRTLAGEQVKSSGSVTRLEVGLAIVRLEQLVKDGEQLRRQLEVIGKA